MIAGFGGGGAGALLLIEVDLGLIGLWYVGGVDSRCVCYLNKDVVMWHLFLAVDGVMFVGVIERIK